MGPMGSSPARFLSTPSVGRATAGREGDPVALAVFLSTPSVGRATLVKVFGGSQILISIHALRGEGDLARDGRDMWPPGFLSTPSVGRATSSSFSSSLWALIFLSTPSVGRATMARAIDIQPIIISIHALRGEGDPFPSSSQGTTF